MPFCDRKGFMPHWILENTNGILVFAIYLCFVYEWKLKIFCASKPTEYTKIDIDFCSLLRKFIANLYFIQSHFQIICFSYFKIYLKRIFVRLRIKNFEFFLIYLFGRVVRYLIFFVASLTFLVGSYSYAI